MKIAFVEDSDSDWFFIKNSLDENDIKADRFTCIEMFEDDGYDLVFTDLSLSKYFGCETVKALREKTASRIIVISGMIDKRRHLDIIADLIHAGAHSVYDKKELLNTSFVSNIIIAQNLS